MPKLTILRGVSGSGKSTWASNQNAVVVSRDNIRAAFFPNFTTTEYYKAPHLRDMEDSVTRIQDAAIESNLKAGKDVIVDNTNIEWKYVKALAKIATRVGAEVEIKVFDVPVQQAITMDLHRRASGGRYVGAAIIRKQHQRFQGNKNKELDPPFVPEPYSGTPGKPKAFLVDIDGTLAHMNGRSPYDWARVGEDDVDDVIANIVDALGTSRHHEFHVIVMSGRDGSCRTETEDWLCEHGIPFDALFMREARDMRADNIVKAELFDKFVRDNFDVQFVLDDRQQVVDMWRSMGLTCLQVAPGEF